jgi:hypothetical protein
MSLYDDFEPDPSHYAKEPPHIANGSKFSKKQTGISLRDFFAAQALIAYHADGNFSSHEDTAHWCYNMADKMLEVRGAK